MGQVVGPKQPEQLDEKKINEPNGTICVVGATGKQGGAVVRGLLAQKKFSIRAITRNPKSKKAKALAAQGVSIVKANLDDTSSLNEAFKGCYGVFAVTNFWADMKPETEVKQAKNIANAAKLNGVQHILWSTLEDTTPVMKGQKKDGDYYVAHFDVKEKINGIFRESGIPTTYVITSFFYENWIVAMPPTNYGNGYVIGMNMADKKLSMMSLEDFGRVAALVFSKPEYQGQKIGFSSDELTGAEIAAILTKHKKVQIGYNPMQDKDMQAAAGTEMSQMFVYYREGQEVVSNLRSIEESAKLTKLTKFESWVASNAARIPLK